METLGTSENDDMDSVDQSRKMISSPDGTEMKATKKFEGCSDFTTIEDVTTNELKVKSETTTINSITLKGHGCSNSCHRNGTMEEGALDILMKETKDVFVETSILERVEESLASYHHVTISGASGEGKTSIALMIGDKYRTRGYQLLLVNNIDRFRLHLDGVKQILLIFDDIFGTVGLSTNVPHLQSILGEIQLFLGDKANTLYVIFTTKTYNLDNALSKLEGDEVSFFKGPSVLDLSLQKDYRYSEKDKNEIFQKHKQTNNFEGSVDIDSICNNDNVTFGFPLTCKLFYRFNNFQKNFEDFFRKPLSYLKTELSRILKLMNNQSAALILMLLCDGSLILQQVESRSEVIESKIKLVENIVGSITPTDIATAARHFRGTFFTEGEIIGFSHPTIYDSCACALYAMNPSLVLQNCSIKFLYERVRPEPVKATAMNESVHIIYVSENYFEIIAGRFAETIEEGNYSMSISHPILKVEALVDRVFEKLNLAKASIFDHIVRTKRAKRLAVLHDVNEDKYLLQWAALAKSLYLVEKILTIGYKFTDNEIIECFNTCAACGNTQVMAYLLQFYSGVISSEHVRNALDVSVDNHHLQVVHILIRHGTGLDTLSHERQKLLFQDAAEQGDRHLCDMIITVVMGNERKQLVDGVFKRNLTLDFKAICNMILGIACSERHFHLADIIHVYCDINSPEYNSWTPVMNAAYSGKKEVFDLLVTMRADLTLTGNYGDALLHLACQRGYASIIEHLLSSFDINSRGDNGWTPVMNAAYGGKKDVFDVLVTKGADLTLIDNNGDTILHLACCGGNTSIVKHLLPSFDINSRGNNGWTPVMNAACSGKKEVFELLMTKGADLTLTDNYGDAVLHLACWGGNTSFVEQLLPSFDVNSRGNSDSTAVQVTKSGKKEDYDLVLVKGADLTNISPSKYNEMLIPRQGGHISNVNHTSPSFDINSRGFNGWTPVMRAACSDKKEVFDMLVTKGADLTLTDNYGYNVLHLACRGGNTSIVEHLLPLFDINSRGNNGCTPVMNAAYSGKKEVFDLLVTKGAVLNWTDNCGDTILHHACWGGNKSIVEHLFTSFDISSRGKINFTIAKVPESGRKEDFGLTVPKGADTTPTDKYQTIIVLHSQGRNKSTAKSLLPSIDINSRGFNGWTPVMRAAYSGKKEVFDMLVIKGADLTLTDNCGETVLHLACQGGNTYIVEPLLPSIDINSRGFNGWTPVMRAAYNGKNEVFDMLVTKGADLTLTDNCGEIVLHVACQGGNVSIVKHLLLSFDINSRGINGWTPVMNAAYNGKNEVFFLLMTKGADLTLTDNNENTVLHLACQGGNTSIVEHLLPSFDINSRGNNGWTPVMNAAYNGKKKIFDILVTKGADLTLTDNNGDTVLQLACRGGNTSIAEHLLPSFDINSRGNNGWTPVMNAAYSGQNEVFYMLVTKGADLTLTDNLGDTVLHLACWGGSTYIVEHLLQSFSINSRGNNGWTPVMKAAYIGKKKVFDLLVTKRADLTLTDNFGDTVLHLTCRGGNTSIVKHLLPSFDINSRGNNGWTPVMKSAYSGKKEVFELLVTKGADLTLTDNYGDTVLQLACRGGNTSIAERLLPLFDIDNRGNSGWTPVMNSAYSGRNEVFDLLVTKGADLTLTDNFGDTVLHLACRGGNTFIVEHLLQSFSINSRGNNGWTPVMKAAYSGKKKVFELLVTKGADLTLTDNFGNTVLHRACHGGNAFIVKHLLPSFDINSRGNNGWTPVMNAAYSGKKEVFDLLVTKGADLTLTDTFGDTELHLACQGGNTSIVEHLLQIFDVNCRGQYGWTPVKKAADFGKKEVLDLLVTKGADLTLTDTKGYTVLHLAHKVGNTSIVEHL